MHWVSTLKGLVHSHSPYSHPLLLDLTWLPLEWVDGISNAWWNQLYRMKYVTFLGSYQKRLSQKYLTKFATLACESIICTMTIFVVWLKNTEKLNFNQHGWENVLSKIVRFAFTIHIWVFCSGRLKKVGACSAVSKPRFTSQFSLIIHIVLLKW